MIGSDGLLLGDAEVDYTTIPCPRGRTRVSVYTDSAASFPDRSVESVTFVLEHMESDRQSDKGQQELPKNPDKA